jgi:hypothetical protein
MNLFLALKALAPALTATRRFVTVTAILKDGFLSAYNGEIVGRAPITMNQEVMVNAERLVKVWQEDSWMGVGEKQVTIRSGKAKFKLNRLHDDLPSPPFVENQSEIGLTVLQREAILLAAKFASTNAAHPWACGVSIGPSGLIATNNQTLVHVPCELDCPAMTLPFWAVNLLNRDFLPPKMSANENMIKFTWADGVILQAQRLAVDMPEQVFQLAGHLTEATDLVDLAPLLKELDKLDSYLCRLGADGLIVETRDAEQAVADVPFNGEFRLSMATAKLVFAHATHISFVDAPQRLRFSKSTEPKLMGFAMGMS